MKATVPRRHPWWSVAVLLLCACSSDDDASSPSGPSAVAAIWTGEITVIDAAGEGVPGLLVQIQYAAQNLPSKSRDAGDIASVELDVYTDHDGIARPQTAEVEQLWIHQLRVSVDAGDVLYEEVLKSTDEESLTELDPTQNLFLLSLSVNYEIPPTRDQDAAQLIIGTWRTAFVDAGVSYGRELAYHADDTFSGVLTQDGSSFPIDGTWTVRNLILTTTFEFNGQSQRHSTRFTISGTTMTTTGIPAGTPREWKKQ